MPDPILVTGAAGFIGARFVESCAKRGVPVVSVDREAHFHERAEHRGVDFGRVIDRDRLFAWLTATTPRLRAFVHLGACSDTAMADADYLARVNLEYSQAAWNWCRGAGIPFAYASSAAVYGGGEEGYDDEEAIFGRLRPLNLYGKSKLDFDRWALAEEKAGRKPPCWSGFRFFNVYGFGERHKVKMSSMVLRAFDQIRAGGPVRLFKSHREGVPDGEQKRDFIWVGDVVDVLWHALEKPIERGIYNLGTGQARSFADLARASFAAMGKPARFEFFDTPAEFRAHYQYFTEARMDRLRATGWTRAFASLEDGVRETIGRLTEAARS